MNINRLREIYFSDINSDMFKNNMFFFIKRRRNNNKGENCVLYKICEYVLYKIMF